MSGVCACVSHIQARPGPTAAQAGGNPGAGRNRMFSPHLLVGLAAALLRFTQRLKMDCQNERESVLEGKTDEHIGRGKRARGHTWGEG